VIEGYSRQLSVVAGETVELCCSGFGPMSVEVLRDGAVLESVWRSDRVEVGVQATPPGAAQVGCGWVPTLEIPVDDAWRSGQYLVRMVGPEGVASLASFVVRPVVAQRAGAVLVLSTSTWNAYNDWGGANLYEGAKTVSFDRPWCRGYLDRPDEPAGRHARVGPVADTDSTGARGYLARHGLTSRCIEAGWVSWERRFVRWAEGRGWRIDVAQSTDLHRDPSTLDGYDTYLSVGHDEYWSGEMRDTVESFVARGGNAAFLSGNTAFWQVRFEGDSMIGHKYEAPWTDPVIGTPAEATMTGMWSDPLTRRPENEMTGVSFSRGGYVRFGDAVPNGSGGYTVWRPHHWVFDRCELRYGDLFGTTNVIVGYEADGCALRWVDGLPQPTGEDGTPTQLEVLATSPAHLWSSTPDGGVELPPHQGHSPDLPADLEYVAFRLFGTMSRESSERITAGSAVLATFQREGGGTVFTVGCTDWAHGLEPDPDATVARITDNVLARFGAVRRPVGTPGPEEAPADEPGGPA